MKLFLTGGAGYIGSHILTELLAQGHEACVFDNFSNSTPAGLERVKHLTQKEFEVVRGDTRDRAALGGALDRVQPDAVIHLAGLKAVGTSTTEPLTYYDNNVQGTVVLLEAMRAANCRRIVFSSSATVYGDPQYLPFDENHPRLPTNPYGRTKMFAEDIIQDWVATDAQNAAVLLRYFNPVGAHASAQIGEDPNDIPNNLMPLISQVAIGRRANLSVFGNDYETRDGTGERDYIHVVDLARAHLAALAYCAAHAGCEAINVGTGAGVTVLEMLQAFETVSGQKIPYELAARRPGDIASSVANADKARALLGWHTTQTLTEMCRSAWAWQSQNPNGYQTS